MDRIWAPWRVEYIKEKQTAGCVFCNKPGENNDAENLILYRGNKNFIIMNAYPYNPRSPTGDPLPSYWQTGGNDC
jgi:ATP adenylyltransferase